MKSVLLERLEKLLERHEKIVTTKDYDAFLKQYRKKHPEDKIENSLLKKLFDIEAKNPFRGLFYAASPLAYSMKVIWIDKFADEIHKKFRAGKIKET